VAIRSAQRQFLVNAGRHRVATSAIGWAQTTTNSFAGGLYLVAFIALTASLIVWLGLKSVARE
jgi:hypothetical protein